MNEIDVVAAKSALGQDCRDVCRAGARAHSRRIDHHAREPRRQWQAAEFSPFLRDPSCLIDGAKLAEQRLRLGEGRGRRRIEERERLRIGGAPLRQVEHHAREVCREDLRPCVGLQ
jgi:hypothetical protein